MKILLRFGDLMLKGGNKNMFLNTIKRHIHRRFMEMNVEIDFRHDRIYLDFDKNLKDSVIKIINEIPGISSYSIIYVSNKDNDSIVVSAKKALTEALSLNKTYTFKVETKRSDKNYPHTSLEFSQIIAPKVLNATAHKLVVDVYNPEVTLHIDIRRDGVYTYIKSVRAMGGYPAGIAGSGLLMASGGIDSPVAGYLAIKQGVEVELIHFESSPLTPLESVNKVIDIAKKLSVYLPSGKIKLHIVPFTNIHKEILDKVSEAYSITIMRRIMYVIAEQYANSNRIPVLINGESIGQVASQTLKSMKVVEAVTTLPIIRPLITYDKIDIINIAEKIDTYKISIRPFNDCCSIYVPKSPVINPVVRKAEFQEQFMDNKEELIVSAIKDIKTLTIDSKTDIDLAAHGFDLTEALCNLEMIK